MTERDIRWYIRITGAYIFLSVLPCILCMYAVHKEDLIVAAVSASTSISLWIISVLRMKALSKALGIKVDKEK